MALPSPSVGILLDPCSVAGRESSAASHLAAGTACLVAGSQPVLQEGMGEGKASGRLACSEEGKAYSVASEAYRALLARPALGREVADHLVETRMEVEDRQSLPAQHSSDVARSGSRSIGQQQRMRM